MKQKRGFIRLVSTVVLALVVLLSLAGCQSEETTKDVYVKNFDVESPTSEFYINDFAEVFTDAQKSEMMKRAVELDQNMDGIQVVVTTVTSLGSHDINEYANAMYNQYGIGNNDMGALIILSTGDRDVRIELGRKMEEYVTSAQAGRLLDDNGMDYFQNDQFAEGLVNVQRATIECIKENVPAAWSTISTVGATPEEKVENSADTTSNTEKVEDDQNGKSLAKAIWSALVGLIVAFAIYTIAECKKAKKKAKEFYKKEVEIIEERVEKNSKKAEEQFKKEKSEMRLQHEIEMDDLRTSTTNEIFQKDEEIKKMKEKFADLTAKHEALSDRYERAQRLYPAVDMQVTEMIENEFKQEAQSIDQKVQEATMQTADREKTNLFKAVISDYEAASEDVKKYITSDITPVVALHDESVELEKEYQRIEKEKRDKQKAQEAYENMTKILTDVRSGSYESYDVLKRANSMYCELTSDQQAFFPNMEWLCSFKKMWSDAKQSHKLYEEAKKAEKSVNEIISGIGTPDEDDRDKLKRAMNVYKGLNSAAVTFFDVMLYEKLKKMLKKANDDHDEQEARRRRKREEEERRRRNSYHSSSSSYHHHSGGSFGGHGGISHGGGASRHF